MMKTILLLAAGLVLFTDTTSALTEVRQITSKRDCPANLKIVVERSQPNHDLTVVSVTLTPDAPKAYEGRVKAFSRLQATNNGIIVFDGALNVTKEDTGFRCVFRIHAESLKESRLTLSTTLFEQDGHPTVGGGKIYEIALRGFDPAQTGTPNNDGAANGSPPVRPDTKVTPPAAGSRR